MESIQFFQANKLSFTNNIILLIFTFKIKIINLKHRNWNININWDILDNSYFNKFITYCDVHIYIQTR